jgi:hypothetical protein
MERLIEVRKLTVFLGVWAYWLVVRLTVPTAFRERAVQYAASAARGQITTAKQTRRKPKKRAAQATSYKPQRAQL